MDKKQDKINFKGQTGGNIVLHLYGWRYNTVNKQIMVCL